MLSMTMSLADIREAGPCSQGWTKFLRHLGYEGGAYDPDRRVTLGDIAASNGAPDAWWCVRCLDLTNLMVRRRVVRALLPACRRAAASTTDTRVAACLDAVDRWTESDDTIDLPAAAAGAYAAAYEARASGAYAAAYAADAATYAANAAADVYAEDAQESVVEAAANATNTAAADAAADVYAADAAAADADAERRAQVADIVDEFGRWSPSPAA